LVKKTADEPANKKIEEQPKQNNIYEVKQVSQSLLKKRTFSQIAQKNQSEISNYSLVKMATE